MATSFFNLEDFNLPASFLTGGGHTGSNNKDLQFENNTKSEDNGHDPSFHHNNDDDRDKESGSHLNHNLSHGEAVRKCVDLVKAIKNNPAKMTKLFVLVENMVKRYRSGHTVEVDVGTCPLT
jgi:hypothetical protein